MGRLKDKRYGYSFNAICTLYHWMVKFSCSVQVLINFLLFPAITTVNSPFIFISLLC